MEPYEEFFERATGRAPYAYQTRLAGAGAPMVLDIPTGLGKTEATVLAWLYRRALDPKNTPRRLFYCLPMRSLVEQTRDRIEKCVAKLAPSYENLPRIEIVMGGCVGEQWFRRPEEPCVVIGTQDMLLSRALNRGYGMSRFAWSMTFGAANDDAYWVLDEVQLQGIGAVTAAQLHAFRERFGTFHPTAMTLASATIDEQWFETADFSLADKSRVSLEADLADARVQRIISAQKRIERATAADAKEIAELVREQHRAGSLTLVVVNRVERAQDIYRHLLRDAGDTELFLVHSRYRAKDRAEHAKCLGSEPDPSGPGRIVVATQVVEAGIDVSAATLLTDVAPWSSLVQRFGRCNRRGTDEDARCIWIDGGEIKKNDAPPYVLEELAEAREMLLEMEGKSAAPADLSKRSIPLREGLVIRRPEFLDLFDTSPDLAGHDVDVSPYIRVADDLTVSLFWRDEPPAANDPPHRDELCPALVSDARDLVKTLRAAGHAGDARIANQFAKGADQAWTVLHDSEVRPGVLVWLRSDVGYYDSVLGFDKKAKQRVERVSYEILPDYSESCAANDSDELSEIKVAIPLSKHAQDTLRHAGELVAAVTVPEPIATVTRTAALWHDTGKAHHIFQDTMRRANSGADGTTVWAKGKNRARHSRRGFRHELPGALAYLNAHGSDTNASLVAYLIAAHHGKLRVAGQQLPFEASCEPFQLLGNQDGEVLPQVDLGDGVISPEVTLRLAPFRIGSTNGERSWVDLTTALRDDPMLGPFKIAYLELLVRLADWRASEEEAKER